MNEVMQESLPLTTETESLPSHSLMQLWKKPKV